VIFNYVLKLVIYKYACSARAVLQLKQAN